MFELGLLLIAILIIAIGVVIYKAVKKDDLFDFFYKYDSTYDEEFEKWKRSKEEGYFVCPNCYHTIKGYEFLTSYPSQYQVKCPCGFTFAYYNRENPYLKITQKEINSFYEKEKRSKEGGKK